METVTITLDYLELEIEFNYTPGDPGVHTYPNGDPGHPPTGPEIEIVKVWIKNEQDHDVEITAVWNAYSNWRYKTFDPKVRAITKDEDGGYTTAEKSLQDTFGRLFFDVTTFQNDLWQEINREDSALNLMDYYSAIAAFFLCNADDEMLCELIEQEYEEDEGPEPEFDDRSDDEVEFGGIE